MNMFDTLEYSFCVFCGTPVPMNRAMCDWCAREAASKTKIEDPPKILEEEMEIPMPTGYSEIMGRLALRDLLIELKAKSDISRRNLS